MNTEQKFSAILAGNIGTALNHLRADRDPASIEFVAELESFAMILACNAGATVPAARAKVQARMSAFLDTGAADFQERELEFVESIDAVAARKGSLAEMMVQRFQGTTFTESEVQASTALQRANMAGRIKVVRGRP